jgi:hypothetical protein
MMHGPLNVKFSMTISKTPRIYKTKICISKRNVLAYAAQKVLELPSEKIAWSIYRITAASLGFAIENKTV